MAGKYLIGEAQLGEYFRVSCPTDHFPALVLHAWRRQKGP